MKLTAQNPASKTCLPPHASRRSQHHRAARIFAAPPPVSCCPPPSAFVFTRPSSASSPAKSPLARRRRARIDFAIDATVSGDRIASSLQRRPPERGSLNPSPRDRSEAPSSRKISAVSSFLHPRDIGGGKASSPLFVRALLSFPSSSSERTRADAVPSSPVRRFQPPNRRSPPLPSERRRLLPPTLPLAARSTPSTPPGAPPPCSCVPPSGCLAVSARRTVSSVHSDRYRLRVLLFSSAASCEFASVV